MDQGHHEEQTSAFEIELWNEKGYPIEIFVSEPSDMFKCSLCRGIFKNAVTCTYQDCGRNFFSSDFVGNHNVTNFLFCN